MTKFWSQPNYKHKQMTNQMLLKCFDLSLKGKKTLWDNNTRGGGGRLTHKINAMLHTRGTLAPVSLNKTDFSDTMKRRF